MTNAQWWRPLLDYGHVTRPLKRFMLMRHDRPARNSMNEIVMQPKSIAIAYRWREPSGLTAPYTWLTFGQTQRREPAPRPKNDQLPPLLILSNRAYVRRRKDIVSMSHHADLTVYPEIASLEAVTHTSRSHFQPSIDQVACVFQSEGT